MTIQKKQFNLITDKIKAYEDEEAFYIEGIANSGLKDLVDDKLTQEALEQIQSQATNHNLHLDHDGSIDGVLGPIKESELVSEGVKIKAQILYHGDKIKHMLEHDVKLGLSINGRPTYEDESFTDIKSWELTEVSITPIPCDQQTMGTVAIAKSFKQIVNTFKGVDNMADEPITEQEVIDLINEANNEANNEIKEEYEETINNLEDKINELETTIDDIKNGKGRKDEDEDEEQKRKKSKDVDDEPLTEIEDKIDQIETLIDDIKSSKDGEDSEAISELEDTVEELETIIDDIKSRKDDDDDEAKDEDEEEETEKRFNALVQKAVDKEVNKALKRLTKGIKKDTNFKYDSRKGKKHSGAKKTYSPREVAEMMAGL